MTVERRVGSLTCPEVLARLSDFIDGDLAAESRAEVEAHLAGCDACERFGGRFAMAVAALRRSAVQEPEGLPEHLRRRLGFQRDPG